MSVLLPRDATLTDAHDLLTRLFPTYLRGVLSLTIPPLLPLFPQADARTITLTLTKDGMIWEGRGETPYGAWQGLRAVLSQTPRTKQIIADAEAACVLDA